MKIGLAMTGGGARGAYQAGVLKRIGEIKGLEPYPCPFKILGAASAGAVNAASVAAGAEDFGSCTKKLARLWSHLHIDDIYRTDLGSLIPVASRWMRDLSFGAIYGGGHATSLLDASPLEDFLRNHIPFNKIQQNIDDGHIDAISVAATSYHSGKTYLFTQRAPGGELWIKSRRIALDTRLGVEHICASAAIPVVFAPVRVKTQYGVDYFGDGCLRLHAPLSPVIRLGADKILAIGVRYKKDTEEQIDRRDDARLDETRDTQPALAQVMGVIFNAIFLDHLDSDVEHLLRLNEIITRGGLGHHTLDKVKEPIKTVAALPLSPSGDIGQIAETYSHKMPAALRYLMAGLGTKKASSSDLVSYLLFDSSYTSALVDLGYKDAQAKIDEIEDFIRKD